MVHGGNIIPYYLVVRIHLKHPSVQSLTYEGVAIFQALYAAHYGREESPLPWILKLPHDFSFLRVKLYSPRMERLNEIVHPVGYKRNISVWKHLAIMLVTPRFVLVFPFHFFCLSFDYQYCVEVTKTY